MRNPAFTVVVNKYWLFTYLQTDLRDRLRQGPVDRLAIDSMLWHTLSADQQVHIQSMIMPGVVDAR